jgi:starch synthase
MAAIAGPIAIFPWGDVIEEFLDPLSLTPLDYVRRMSGGWLFGYVAALESVGQRSVVVYASEQVREPERLIHGETGAPIWLVPGVRSGHGRTRGRPSLRAAMQWVRSPMIGFANVLRRERCTAMLAQDYEHARFDALVLLAKLMRLPMHASFQGGELTLSPLESIVRGWSLRGSKSLIVPSRRERQRLEARYAGRLPRIVEIPNPIDSQKWRPESRRSARQALGLSDGEFLAVNHGRIDIQRKGLDVLLRAWTEFTNRRSNGRLVIIGSGQDHAAFEALVGKVPRTTWISAYLTDPPQIRRWLSAADVYVTLSRLEGMPVAPLEAMACGLPVVASDANGLPDIFADGEASGGLLVPREAVTPAAEAICRLADHGDLRRRMGAAARRNVETRYSLAVVGSKLLDELGRGSCC